MINIALCFDDNYIMPTGVLLTSICFSNKENEISFYIISDSLSEKNKKALLDITSQFPYKKIIFIEFSIDKISSLPIHLPFYSLAIYYRLLLPELLPSDIDKVLYLDCDMLVVDDLKEFYSTDLSKFSTAIVPDMFYDDEKVITRLKYSLQDHYYNAGMLLINLNYWRKNNITVRSLDFVINNKELCTGHDQDALNAILHGTILDAPCRYNIQIDFLKKKNKLVINDVNKLKEAVESTANPCIIHYTGPSKPWKFQCFNPFEPLWHFFQNKTIWKNLPKTHEFHGFKLFKWTIKHILEITHLRHKRINEYYNVDKVISEIIRKYQ